MSLPNTTPTPNDLYDSEMKNMSDTELRVVMMVVRATFGWVINKKTGMRKEEDWISTKQLTEKTGRSNRAVANAIDNCIKRKWIEARNKQGELLNTSEKRSGNKLFYRLGLVFLDKAQTSEHTSQVPKPVNLTTQTSELNDTKPVNYVHSTKETSTKENIQKEFFSLFWNEYPRKEKKQPAKKVFLKLKPNGILFKEIMQALKQFQKCDQWKDKKFIPHPTTWLNEKRWEDEIIIKSKSDWRTAHRKK